METHAITVITPTTRPEMLPIIQKCLRRQDFTDFEWIIVSPKEISTVTPTLLLKDPPKQKGDFWTLCKGWNKAYAHAKGQLIVNIQDGIWFDPYVLSKFWFHYQNNPKALVTAVGHQYEELDDLGMPITKVWDDPRLRAEGTFIPVGPNEVEMVMCSIPKQAILDCGGIDEEYDTCNGAQEKEMCFRLRKLGYEFYMDQNIEYRAIHHPRLTEDWDRVYKEKTTPLFIRHMNELETGRRVLNVNSISKYQK